MPREPVNGQQLTAALRACSAAGSTVRVGERAARDRQGPCPRGADDLVGVACVLGRFGPIQLCAALWTVARQAPLSLGFSRQECWSELPCPPPGELPAQGRNLCSPTCCTGRRVLHHWHRLGSSVGWRRRQLRRWWEVLGRKVSGQWDRGGMGVTAPRSLRMIQLQCRGPEGRTEKQSWGPRRTGRAGGGGCL